MKVDGDIVQSITCRNCFWENRQIVLDIGYFQFCVYTYTFSKDVDCIAGEYKVKTGHVFIKKKMYTYMPYHLI
jgi:hypothetical protein